MAITVKEIREKDFNRARNGFDMNEVDDFLDAIAEQFTSLVQENLSLAKQINAQPEPEQKPAESAAEEPAYDENSYFKNLESTLRETLISGQRIADDTVSKAQREADEVIARAKEEADAIIAKAKQSAEELAQQAAEKVAKATAQEETMKAAVAEYKLQIRRMIEAQQKILVD